MSSCFCFSSSFSSFTYFSTVSPRFVNSNGRTSLSASRMTAVPTVWASARPYTKSVSRKCVKK